MINNYIYGIFQIFKICDLNYMRIRFFSANVIQIDI